MMNILLQSKYRFMGILFLTALLFISCDEDTVAPEDNNPPATYTFENVDYAGQTTRLDMLEELVAYMKTANTIGTELDAFVMGNMYNNTESPFADDSLNQSDKNLYSKTVFTVQTYFEGLMLDFAKATVAAGGTPGEEGKAGVVTSQSGEKSYFLSAEGKEYTQLIEKGLMGAVMYNQVTSVYLSEAKIGDAVAKADMEHHWDEAFGYLGLPEDYPNGDARFLGKYIVAREGAMSSATKIMDAAIAGRHAIVEGNMATKDAQAQIIIAELEKAIAGTAVYYLNFAQKNLNDAALCNHALSEAEAFIRSLKFNDSKVISQAQIDELLAYLGDDFYQMSADDISGAKAILVAVYGFSDIADSL